MYTQRLMNSNNAEDVAALSLHSVPKFSHLCPLNSSSGLYEGEGTPLNVSR